MLMSLTALMGGVLNAVNRFGPFAAAPILFNLTLIAFLLFAAPYTATGGHALAYGVVASGVLQLVWLAWSCRRAGVVLHLRRPKPTARIGRLFRLIAPGAIGAGVMQDRKSVVEGTSVSVSVDFGCSRIIKKKKKKTPK